MEAAGDELWDGVLAGGAAVRVGASATAVADGMNREYGDAPGGVGEGGGKEVGGGGLRRRGRPRRRLAGG